MDLLIKRFQCTIWLVGFSRLFPQGFKVRVPGTPLCGVEGSFNKI